MNYVKYEIFYSPDLHIMILSVKTDGKNTDIQIYVLCKKTIRKCKEGTIYGIKFTRNIYLHTGPRCSQSVLLKTIYCYVVCNVIPLCR